MKNRTKIALLVSAISAVLGCVLIGVGLGCGAHLGIIWDRDGLRAFDTRAEEQQEPIVASLDAFQNVDVRLSPFYQAEVVTSDHYGIEIIPAIPMQTTGFSLLGSTSLRSTPDYSVSDGGLSISDTSGQTHWFGLLVNLDLFHIRHEENRPRVIIYVPSDTRLGSMAFDCGGRVIINGQQMDALTINAQGITLSDIQGDQLELKSPDASSSLERVTARQLTCQTASASATLKDVSVSGELKGTSHDGSLLLDTVTAQTATLQNHSARIELSGVSVGEGLTVENRDGSVKLLDSRAGKISVKNGSASVSLSNVQASDSLTCAARDGSLELSGIQAGTITLSNQSASTTLHEIRGADGGQAGSLTFTGRDGSLMIEDLSAKSVQLQGKGSSFRLQKLEADHLTLEHSDGSVTLDACTTNALNLTNRGGSTTLSGVFRGNSQIKTRDGSVRMTNAVPKEETAWDLQSGSGSIQIDGVKQKGGTYRSDNPAAVHHITMETTDYTIQLDFVDNT